MLGVSVSCIILVFWSICRLRCFARPVDLSVQPRSITYTSRLNSSFLIFDERCEFVHLCCQPSVVSFLAMTIFLMNICICLYLWMKA